MKILGYIVLIQTLMSSMGNSDFQIYRYNYSKAATDKIICEKMIRDLEKVKNNSVIYLGYLGGYQTIWANHIFDPISKLNTFNKGKKNIEQAIDKEPNNVELRFVRLSVQKNAPNFLGYHTYIKTDKEFIIKNRNQIQSEILAKNIDLLLKD